MPLTQAADFLEETESLHAAVAPLDALDLTQKTQFKGWTIEDILVHLHFWNQTADLSAFDVPAFETRVQAVLAALKQDGSMRAAERAAVHERGTALRDLWREYAQDMANRWADMDPKKRLPWVGPSMSARSSLTARQMETWAHGFEVFDLLGLARSNTDRLKNIVVLGVNTFGWSHQVHNLPVPAPAPKISLTAPSGAVWSFGEDPTSTLTGSAEDFAAVVTQTRAFADTGLVATGATTQTWMAHAQCFAGPAESPPAPGSRHKQSPSPT